jgi:hypothetical protein
MWLETAFYLKLCVLCELCAKLKTYETFMINNLNTKEYDYKYKNTEYRRYRVKTYAAINVIT